MFSIVPLLTTAPLDAVFYRRGAVILRAEGARARRPNGTFAPYRLAGYRLYLNGRRTDVRFAPDEVDDSPSTTIDAHRTRGGIVYGTVYRIVSGATLASGTYAFIGERGWQYRVRLDVAEASGERLLLRGGEDERNPVVERPFVYAEGRLHSIGPATKVRLEATGRVTGWVLVDAGDRVYEPGFESRGPLYRRYFVWRDGKRWRKGRELDR